MQFADMTIDELKRRKRILREQYNQLIFSGKEAQRREAWERIEVINEELKRRAKWSEL